jgi:hypothetical protein
VLDSIREALWRGDFPLRDWVEFLDHRREETDRHIFLFRLPASNIELPSITPTFVWGTEEPVLVGTSNDRATNKATLQLVGWRAASGDGRRSRRAMTFVRIDLAARTMELQLPLMRGGGMQALLAERDLYVRTISGLLQIQPEPVHLEHAIRALLGEKRLELKYWMVRTPKGGQLRFRENLVFLPG